LYLNGPVEAWDDALAATGINGIPSFTTTTDQGQADVTVTGVSSGTTFCGQFNDNTKVLTVYNAATPDCNNFANTGGISELLTHELGHVVGWAGGTHAGHNGGVSGVSDHCALALPSSGGFNTTICHHNIEGVLAGYGLRSLSSTYYWQTPFVVSHNGPTSFSPISLEEGEADTLQLGTFFKERGGTLPGSWSTYSSDASVATVSSGIITAVDSGSAIITIAPSTGSGYFLTSILEASSRTVQVTVTPQAPAALVVQDITINTSLPITTTGVRQWTAVVGSGSTAGMSFRWVFEYSDNSPPDSVFVPARQSGDPGSPWIKPPPPDTVYVGAAQSVSQSVHEGDYTIWVKVWPIRNGVAGSPAAREYSVCTSQGGGDDLRATPEQQPKSGGGGGETEAVEGCA
jgi:hypothetical protein